MFCNELKYDVGAEVEEAANWDICLLAPGLFKSLSKRLNVGNKSSNGDHTYLKVALTTHSVFSVFRSGSSYLKC